MPRVATYEVLADLLDIGRATVSRIMRLHAETGNVEPKRPTAGPPPILNEVDRQVLAQMVEDRPDATLDQLADAWTATHRAAGVCDCWVPSSRRMSPTYWFPRSNPTTSWCSTRRPTAAGRSLALAARMAARTAGTLWYSPDLNPSELGWSKIRELMRRRKARSAEELDAAIAAAAAKVTASDVAAWFARCASPPAQWS